MNVANWVGAAMIFALFGGLFAVACRDGGFFEALKIFGIVAGLVSFITVAVVLLGKS